MPTAHWDYPNLMINDGAKGEPATGGAFYRVKSGDSLSRIAATAYSDGTAWRHINKSAYNADHFIYRADSSKCSSAKTKAPSGYLALCVDPRYLTDPERKWPVIWIPTQGTWLEPDDMPKAPTPDVAPPKPLPTLQVTKPPAQAPSILLQAAPLAPGDTDYRRAGGVPGDGSTTPGPLMASLFPGFGTADGGGVPWWVWLLGAGVIVGGVVLAKRGSKGKRSTRRASKRPGRRR